MSELAHFDELESLSDCSGGSCVADQELLNSYELDHHHGMMFGFDSGVGSLGIIAGWIFWLLVIGLLISLIRWAWKQGDKK